MENTNSNKLVRLGLLDADAFWLGEVLVYNRALTPC